MPVFRGEDDGQGGLGWTMILGFMKPVSKLVLCRKGVVLVVLPKTFFLVFYSSLARHFD